MKNHSLPHTNEKCAMIREKVFVCIMQERLSNDKDDMFWKVCVAEKITTSTFHIIRERVRVHKSEIAVATLEVQGWADTINERDKVTFKR